MATPNGAALTGVMNHCIYLMLLEKLKSLELIFQVQLKKGIHQRIKDEILVTHVLVCWRRSTDKRIEPACTTCNCSLVAFVIFLIRSSTMRDELDRLSATNTL